MATFRFKRLRLVPQSLIQEVEADTLEAALEKANHDQYHAIYDRYEDWLDEDCSNIEYPELTTEDLTEDLEV